MFANRYAPLADGAIASLMICGILGCGSNAPVEVTLPPTHNNLRNFTLAYAQASNALKHPPRNADEIKPFVDG